MILVTVVLQRVPFPAAKNCFAIAFPLNGRFSLFKQFLFSNIKKSLIELVDYSTRCVDYRF